MSGSTAVERRRGAIAAAQAALLKSLCAPGDFLPASRRSALVREAWAARGGCEACLGFRGVCLRKNANLFAANAALPHSHADAGACGGLAATVHALVNLQHLLKESWYDRTAQFLRDLPGLLPEGGGDDEVWGCLTEIIVVVALANGCRTVFLSQGLSLPALPPPDDSQPPRFRRVSDFCSSVLKDEKMSWGRSMRHADLKPGGLAAAGLDPKDFLPAFYESRNPLTKYSLAPGSMKAFVDWAEVVYIPMTHVLKLSKELPFPHRCLTRPDLEMVAYEYTKGVNCSFCRDSHSVFRDVSGGLTAQQHPCADQMKALSSAHAVEPENSERLRQLAADLCRQGGEHVLLDTAGTIGLFAAMTIVVDAAGHSFAPFAVVAAALQTVVGARRHFGSLLLAAGAVAVLALALARSG